MQLGLSRRNIGRLVLLGWAVSLAWLARRQFIQGEQAETTERTTRLAPGARYFAVYAAGQQIGQLNMTVDTLVDGVRIAELLLLDVPAGGSTHQLAREADYVLSRSLRLRQFTRTDFGIGPQERLDGSVGSDSLLRLVESEAPLGPASRSQMALGPDDLLPSILPYRVAFSGRLHVGAEFSLPAIDLTGGATRQVAVRVTAESTFVVPDSAVFDSSGGQWVPATTDTIRAFRIEHDATGSPTIAWVDAGGELISEHFAGGISIQRSAFEMVRNNYRERRKREAPNLRRRISGMVTLASTGKIPDSVAASRSFVVETDSGSVRWSAPRDFAGGRQQSRGDTVEIFRQTRGDSISAIPSGALDATWEIPAGEAAIRQAAATAAQGARTVVDSARRLTGWVFRQIGTDTSQTGSASAVFTLRAGKGSADGKARLLAAMARAAGIPARVVSGLALLPEGSYGHVWTEIWLGRWVAADPTFGQFPASASLLRLAAGRGSRALDQTSLSGSARFLPIRNPR